MHQKYLQLHTVRLAYTEVNSESTNTIFLVHGNSGSSQTWQEVLKDPSLHDYRLIAVDLPGHGGSSFSSQPLEDYSPIGTAKILAEALKMLAADKPYILVGFSYGTNLVAEMLNYDLYPKGLFMIGMCCLGKDYGMDNVFQQNEQPSIFFHNEENNSIVREFIQQSLRNENAFELVIIDYFKTDKHFRPSLMQAAAEGKISDEIAAIKSLNIPCLVLFGIKDNLVNINYLDDLPFTIWHNKVYKLQNSGHWVHLETPEIMNQLLLEYAEDAFKETRILQPG